MATGGLASLPIRLGGSSEEGWDVAQFTRVALDVWAMQQVLPLAIIEVTIDDIVVGPRVTCAFSRAGRTVDVFTPAITYVTDGFGNQGVESLGIVFPWSFQIGDETRGWTPRQAWGIILGTAASSGLQAQCVVDGSTILCPTPGGPLLPGGAESVTVWLIVSGQVEPRDWREYGAAFEKRNNTSEQPIPYAAWMLRELESGVGSFFAKFPASYAKEERIATARVFGYVMRMSERQANNRNPNRAGLGFSRWMTAMDIPRGQGSEWEARQFAAMIQFFTATGAIETRLDAALRTLFGDSFVGITRHEGTFDSPPIPTYWPGGTEGPATHDLGDGVWLSDRSRITIQLQRVPTQDDNLIARLAQSTMHEFLSRVLPGWCTFDFSMSTTGFLLGTSILGRDSL